MSTKLQRMCLGALLCVLGTSAWALDKVGGAYQIGSAQDFKDFAALVNGGETTAWGVLTADIDMGIDGTMIGCDANRFCGTFDGQGHSITVNAFPEADGQAIFRNLGKAAVVQNLKVQGTITTAHKYAAGIAAWGRGFIRNCWVDLTVKSGVAGDATHGGVVACPDDGLFVEDCLVQLDIQGSTTQNCGGVCGWLNGNVSVMNTLVLNDRGNFDKGNGSATIARNNDARLASVDLASYLEDIPMYSHRPSGATFNNYATQLWGTGGWSTKLVTLTNADELASGKICYQLNNDQGRIAWRQTIGTDNFPVPAVFAPGHGQVFASQPTGCDGLAAEGVTFSNTGTAQATRHQLDKFGVCHECGYTDIQGLEWNHATHKLIVRNDADFLRAEGLNRASNGGWFGMELEGDISVTGDSICLGFNLGDWYGGDVDGKGHSITVNYTNAPDYTALFPNFQGSVSNLVLHGSISGTRRFYGGISGKLRGDTKVKNLYSDLNVSTTYAGDATMGSIFGDAGAYTLENVIATGNVTGSPTGATICGAGIAGWTSGRGTMKGVVYLGTISDMNGDTWNISRHGDVLAPTDVYYLNPVMLPSADDPTKLEEKANTNIGKIEEADLASGRLAFLLNGKVNGAERFYQQLPGDAMPMPFPKDGALVYGKADSYRCDGDPQGETTYSNTPFTPAIPGHEYDQFGFCSSCGQINEHFLTPAADGYYEVSTPQQLLWWNAMAATKDRGASLRLTKDIDMGGFSDRWLSVGTEDAPYYGNVDGQYHKISNLNIRIPDKNGVGFIGVMNSLSQNSGDTSNRDSVGVFVQNLTLDETCSITGGGYTALIGMTANFPGNVTIRNLGMGGDVECLSGPNAGGILGCVMGSNCRVTIDNCYCIGDVKGSNENGAFSGWLGSYAEVKNCYALGTVQGVESDAKYWARFGDATITNCYGRYGTQVPKLNEEDIADGMLAYKLNGESFKAPIWFQTLDGDNVDKYPVPIPTHGVIAQLCEKYYSITQDNLSNVIEDVINYENDKLSSPDLKAQTAVIDACREKVDALAECDTLPAFSVAYDTVSVYKKQVDNSAKAYTAYINKCEELKTYLDTHDDFEGAERDALQAYLEENNEPDEENTLGTYEYVMENLQADDVALKAEVERLDAWLAKAISEGYMAGTDVTTLVANNDFSQGNKGWDGTGGNITVQSATFQADDLSTKTIYGAEVWNANFDRSQTIEHLRPGYYLISLNGAYRPANDRYSLNYGASFAANGVTNFLQTVIEDPILMADTLEQVNCNMHGATADLMVWEDGETVEGEDGMGYVVQGQIGLACAINANRYRNSVIAEVGEDSTLVINIKNPGSGLTPDWTGFGNLRMRYCGELSEATDGLDEALASMLARANTIAGRYVFTDVAPVGKAPNFPAAMRTALDEAIAAAEAAEDNESKAASIAALSALFNDIYEGKQAYKEMYNTAATLETVSTQLADVLGAEGYDACQEAVTEVWAKYVEGSASVQEALHPQDYEQAPMRDIIPARDTLGVYQLASPYHMAYFNGMVTTGADAAANAVMTADIDMSPFQWPSIGTYSGVFDGQGHTLTLNIVSIPRTENSNEGWGSMFQRVENDGRVQNLVLRGAITSDYKYAAPVISDMAKATIDRCDVSMTITSTVSGDGTHGGLVGRIEANGALITNCYVHNTFIGSETNSCGGLVGWSGSKCGINNIFVANVCDEKTGWGTSGSDIAARNTGNATKGWIYYLKPFGGTTGCEQVNDTQVKSGELCYKLNHNRTVDTLVTWYQTVGVDTLPRIFGPKDIVYYYGYDNSYSNTFRHVELNSYAYAVKGQGAEDGVHVTYALNSPAKAAEVNFYSAGELVHTEQLHGPALEAGQHEVVVENQHLGADGTVLTYDVRVTSHGVFKQEWFKMGGSEKAASVYGLCSNNLPENPGFGTLYVAESRADMADDQYTGMISEKKHSAIFAYDPLFQPILSADSTAGFQGGLATGGALVISDSNPCDFKDVTLSADGRLFIARSSGTTNSPVWEANPADLNEPWSPVFTGGELDPATGITWLGDDEQSRCAVAMDVEGQGESLKMWILGGARSDGEKNTTDFNCLTYDLGTAKAWSAAPSGSFQPLNGVYTETPTHVHIATDKRGGLWFKQRAGTPSEERPVLKHFNAQGVEDYSSITGKDCWSAIAVSADGTHIAMATDNSKVVVYQTDYEVMPNGKIMLSPLLTVSTSEKHPTAMAFDYANNLIVAASDNGSKSVSRYVIPSWTDNVTVTPAVGTITVNDTATGVAGVGNARTQGGDAIYNLSGQRVGKAKGGVYIIDGKKVAVK